VIDARAFVSLVLCLSVRARLLLFFVGARRGQKTR